MPIIGTKTNFQKMNLFRKIVKIKKMLSKFDYFFPKIIFRDPTINLKLYGDSVLP